MSKKNIGLLFMVTLIISVIMPFLAFAETAPNGDVEKLRAKFDKIEANLPELKTLLSQCQDKGIPTDYETISYTIIKHFIQYGRDDINHGFLSRAQYVAEELKTLHNEAIANLKAYLKGKKKPFEVPRYISGVRRPEIKGSSFIADTEMKKIGGEIVRERRPVFFIGYHYFQKRLGYEPITQFHGYGANIASMEIGPWNVILPGGPLSNWNIGTWAGARAIFLPDATMPHSGNNSLRVTNQSPSAPHVHGWISQRVAVQPETTYRFRAYVKAKNLSKAYFVVGPYRKRLLDGTYNWQPIEFEFVTGENQTGIGMILSTNDVTEGLWVDDIELVEYGTTENLIVNGGFEEIGDGRDYIISTAAIERDVIRILEKAQQNNISVALLLSPHNFPGFALSKWPETNHPNDGFIEFSINAPKARKIIETHLRTVIPMVKDYASLHSIILSNEPMYNTRRDPNALKVWHEFLRDRYDGDIKALNRIYGTAYSVFEDVQMPLRKEPTPHYYDWVVFNNKFFAGWHRWMADTIREIAPEVPLHTKIFGFNLLLYASIWGVNPEDFAQFLDFQGLSAINYLGIDRLGAGPNSFLRKLMFYDVIRSTKRAPVFNSENHIIPVRDTRYIPEKAPHVYADMWQGAVHGRSASTTWVWERTHDVKSDLADSIKHRPDVVKAMGRANLDLNRLAHEVTALQNTKTHVAILYSVPSLVYSPKYQEATDSRVFNEYFDTVNTVYDALTFSGQRVGFVSERQIQAGKLPEYKILVIPNATHIERDTLPGIKDFVAEGGKVVIVGNNSLSKDERNKKLPTSDREYIFKHSTAVDSPVTIKEFRETMLEILEDLGLLRVMLIDTTTGEPVLGVAWLSTIYDNRLLVNICNYEGTAKNLLIKVDGKPVDGFKELISGKNIESASLLAEPRNPLLLSIVQ